jgi:hypothetical protein
VKKSGEHPVTRLVKSAEKQKLMYYDHIVPTPGKAGKVVVADPDGAPVVVVGELGHGKVVFDGSINVASVRDGECAFEERCLFGFNAALTRGAIEWFTGVRLTERQ